MENRGGTSIEELMRGGGQNSNMNDDDDVINSILSEINADKEQMVNNQQMQEQKMQEQKMQEQKMQQHQMQQQQMQQQKMHQMQQEQMMKKQMEIQRMREQDKIRMDIKDNDKNMCENVSLLDEFKSSMIFFMIFMLLNLTQINNLICGALSIENNNIFILLKTFVATVIFFFINKLVHKYI
jgi:flagellar biosynthesis GTPase FlhF